MIGIIASILALLVYVVGVILLAPTVAERENNTHFQEAEKVRIDAKGKADANRILNSSLTTNILRDKGIEATTKLSESPNAKVIVIGSGKDGLPIILGNQ